MQGGVGARLGPYDPRDNRPADPLHVLIQPYGAVLVFERRNWTLVQASESLPRVLPTALHSALGERIEALLEPEMVDRVRALGSGADARHIMAIQGRLLDVRLVGFPDCVMVEIEPSDEATDPSRLDNALDAAAEALAGVSTLADVGRVGCAQVAETTGFASVTLARTLPGDRTQIVAEVTDGLLASVTARPHRVSALARLGRPGMVAFLRDTMATPVGMIARPGEALATAPLAAAELLAPLPALLATVRADGVKSVAVLPIAVDEQIWGYFLLEHGQPLGFGHHRRRLCLALTQLVGDAIRRVQRAARQRAEQLAPETVAAFEATVETGVTPLDALLFGEQLLAAAAGADGAAVLCGDEFAVVGHTPDPMALLARLPELLLASQTHIATDRLDELGGFTETELARNTGMLAVMVARSPCIALAAFRGRRKADGDSSGWSWDPQRIEAFLALARVFRSTLLLADAAAAVELSSQLGEFEERAFGPAMLRTAILSSSPSGMGLLVGSGDESVDLAEYNPMFRRLFGLDRGEPVGGTTGDIAARLGLPRGVFSDSGGPAAEMELWSSELGPRVVEIDTRSIVRARVGGVSRSLTLLQVSDITRIRRQETGMRIARDQALALIRTRDELLANMSHELRTPLNAVIGFADMIAQETLGPIGNPRYAGYARDIETAGRHLLSLINDVLDLSRIASGREVLDDEVVDLRELVQSSVEWARAAARRAVTLVTDVEGDSLLVRCDERAVRQVLINLISNALKFTPGDGKVTVIVRWRPRNAVVIDVTDEGIGMTPAELNRVFEPFFRGKGAFRNKIEGAGLGLSIARSLMELHGGGLSLSSAEGRGTTARLELPAWRVVPGIA